MKQMEVNNLLQVQPTYKTPVRIFFLLDMKNFVLTKLTNVVWEKTPLMCLPIYQKIQISINKILLAHETARS